jgi:hypothetical protein
MWSPIGVDRRGGWSQTTQVLFRCYFRSGTTRSFISPAEGLAVAGAAGGHLAICNLEPGNEDASFIPAHS